MAKPLLIEIHGDASGAMNVLGQLGASVEHFSAKVEGQFNGLANVVEKFQAPLLALAGALGGGKLFKEAISETVSLGVETAKVQRVMGGTTQEASTLALAIGKIHGDTETYLGGIKKLVTTLNKNEEGMNSMGVATRDSSKNLLSMQEIVNNTNKALLEYKIGADRDAAAQTLLGKSWSEWLLYLKVTPELLKEAGEEGRKLGIILGPEGALKIAKYRDTMHEVEEVFEAVKINVGLKLMPYLVELGNWFAEHGPAVIAPVVAIVEAFANILSSTTFKVAALVLAVQTMGPTVVLWVGNMGSALLQLAGRLIGIQGPLTATAAAINPWILATAVVGALVYGIERLVTAKERERQAYLDALPGEVAKAKQTEGMTLRYRDLVKAMDAGNKTEAEKKKIQKELQEIQDQLVAMAPEYAKALSGEALGYREILAAMEKVEAKRKQERQDKRDSIALELEALKVKKLRLEQEEKTPRVTGREGAAMSLGALVTGNNAAAVGKQIEVVAAQLAIADAALRKLESGPDGAGGDKRWHGIVEASKAADEMLRLEALRQSYAEKVTLAEKETADLKAFQLKIDEETLKIKTLAKTDEGGASKASVELEKIAVEGKLAIEAKYARERLQIDETTRRELEVAEQLGWSKEAATLRAKFEKINETRAKAGLDALAADQIEEVITLKRAQRADSERKRLESGLEELAKAKGRALSFDEQLGALDELAKKLGVDLPEAVRAMADKITAAQVQSKNGWAGMRVAIDEWLNKTRQGFETMKQFAASMMGALEGVVSSELSGMLKSTQKFSNDILRIWHNILNAIIDVITQLIAKWLVFNMISMGMGGGFVGMRSFLGLASGGMVTSPTLALIGEGGQPEIVAPQSDFRAWAAGFASMGANLAASVMFTDAQVRGYQSRTLGDVSGGSAAMINDLRGAIIVADDRTLAELHRRGRNVLGSRNG